MSRQETKMDKNGRAICSCPSKVTSLEDLCSSHRQEYENLIDSSAEHDNWIDVVANGTDGQPLPISERQTILKKMK